MVMLDERDLVDPRGVPDSIQHVRVRVVGAVRVFEDLQREVEAHRGNLTARSRAGGDASPAYVMTTRDAPGPSV